MSWFSIFKKARDAGFQDEELALLEQQAREEVESVFSRNGHNGAQEEALDVQSTPAYRRPVAHAPVLARSTKRANVLPLRDWQTIPDVANSLGLDLDEVERVVDEGGLARVPFSRAPGLVHVRQVAYWLEHHKRLDVDMGVFDEWKRQAVIARETGIDARQLSLWIKNSTIAVYKPAPKLVLLNEREVYHVATRK